MTEEPGLMERLRALEPPKKPRKEKWRKVEENLAGIYEARDRRVPWQLIADTLSADGIVVSVVDLRIFVSKIKRDLKKYPKVVVARTSRKTVVRKAGGTRSATSRVKPAAEAEEATKISPEPNPGPSPRHAATRSSREI